MPQNASLIQLMFWLIGGVATAGLGYLGLRFTTKSAARASNTLHAEEWNSLYRSAAENHLQWDWQVRTEYQVLRHELDQILRRQGLPVPSRPELPPPPPLFPTLKRGDK